MDPSAPSQGDCHRIFPTQDRERNFLYRYSLLLFRDSDSACRVPQHKLPGPGSILRRNRHPAVPFPNRDQCFGNATPRPWEDSARFRQLRRLPFQICTRLLARKHVHPDIPQTISLRAHPNTRSLGGGRSMWLCRVPSGRSDLLNCPTRKCTDGDSAASTVHLRRGLSSRTVPSLGYSTWP